MRILITGGAGFVGCNLAAHLAREGHDVVVLDNLSRAGSEENLRWLLGTDDVRERITFADVDVRNAAAVADVVGEAPTDSIAHLAAQTAVTTSLTDPRTDFEINAGGTLNVLEAVRLRAPEANVLFMSTNKVYGSLAGYAVTDNGCAYTLDGYPHGVPEELPVAPTTPYGCSKYAADAYVRDYGEIYGVASTVFRASCVYGPHQNGTTDQGWVAWFAQAVLHRKPITIYGDGRQVRDLLHIDDLVAAATAVLTRRAGADEIFNMGGGADFALAIWSQFGPLLQELSGIRADVSYAPERPGDQKVWISDIRKAIEVLDWKPIRAPEDGVADLVDWLRTNGSR
ncbi:NAD-dependent epimerase/dehydratase family protein [Micromonospora sp. NPDC049900]|uniref:NAD-dependent epimerase/dehydratase family protein n=1 Tax=Micromonospora sp. NPDC049900 TaxID=3364275 RepID=UPI0037B342ED